jgi:hypothetical protein
MNHRFDKRDHHVYLIVIDDNYKEYHYFIHKLSPYDKINTPAHWIYLNKKTDAPCINYLIFNNICTIDIEYYDHKVLCKLLITSHALLELI